MDLVIRTQTTSYDSRYEARPGAAAGGSGPVASPGEGSSDSPNTAAGGLVLTIAGSGDAFGSGGRGNTTFRVQGATGTVAIDFGATALLSWNRLGLATSDIDAVVLSHLHGDHFGGLPFLLLESQFVAPRTRPLTIIGPPGTRARLEMACDAFFPGMTGIRWKFEWAVQEMQPGGATEIAGFDISSRLVQHPSGAPATGVRVSGGGSTIAYSGDTGWVDSLFELADGADAFLVECYSGQTQVPNHIDWPTLRANLGRFNARRIIATHLGRTALPFQADMEASGVSVAEDGKVFTF